MGGAFSAAKTKDAMRYGPLYERKKKFAELTGTTLISVTANDAQDEIRFVTNTGQTYIMYHDQDCCEGVSIESIVGDFADLIGTPILMAEEVESGDPEGWVPGEYTESYTWTFYKLATTKGYVDIRWYGESNGYYSESVDFALLTEHNPS